MSEEPSKPTEKPALAHPDLPANHPRNVPAMAANIFRPGQTGNPKGRPTRKTLEQIVEEQLDIVAELDKEGNPITRREALGLKFVDMMLHGDNATMMKEYLERKWPKIRRVEMDATIDGKLQLIEMDSEDLKA